MAAQATSGNGDRHCALCLKFLPAGTAKICSGCHRRAYCSKECQLSDWKQSVGSQGHKNWCQLEYGEEDIDWEVKPVEGKGLGIVAKRFFSSKSRIMVEAFRTMIIRVSRISTRRATAIDGEETKKAHLRHGQGILFFDVANESRLRSEFKSARWSYAGYPDSIRRTRHSTGRRNNRLLRISKI